MHKKALLLVFSLLFLFTKLQAQTPDWSTGVAPILYNHCTSCHHNGGIAPFSLLNYSDAVSNANAMATDVQIRKMPPWPPDPSYTRLAHERLLTTQEINTITNWVNGGKAQGNISLAPPPPVYNNNGDIPGTPDFNGRIPTFTSTASSGDVYQCFVIPNTQSIDRYITAFEAIPGNAGIVHHVLVFADTTGICRHLDSLYPGPGYVDFGGVGTDSAVLIGGWVPGSAPIIYPSPFGVKLPHNADIVLQIHYPAGTAGQKDSTQIHFFFSLGNTGMRDLFIEPVLNHSTTINTPLYIPANQTRSFHESYVTPPIAISLLGIAPHMHLLGQNISAYGVTSANDTEKYIRINKWDFHWQGFYLFRNIVKIPANTNVQADAFYDNTTANPENPSSPPKDVYAGESTTDEMMLVFFVFALYQNGDENIVIDSTPLVSLKAMPVTYYHGKQLLTPYPNPASKELVVKCYFDEADKASINLLDLNGKTVQQFAENLSVNNGYSAFTYPLANLPNGEYVLQLNTSKQKLSQKLVIQH